jgi:TonB family protein
MIFQNNNEFLYGSGALQWRRESVAWTMSIAIHIPLLLFKGVPYLASTSNIPLPLAPVEISLTQEENVSVPEGAAAAAAAAGPAITRTGAMLSRIKSVFHKKRDPWENFEVSGPFGNTAPSGGGKSGSGGGGGPGGGGGGGSLKVADADTSRVTAAWSPTSSKGKKTNIASSFKSMDDDLGSGGGIAGSPWKAPRAGGGGGGGGQLRGTGTGDMANATASNWGASNAGTRESRAGGADGGEGGSSTGGGGNNFYDLRGPLSKRKVVYSLLPPYPDWARERGFEAVVTVYFTVLPDGSLKEPLIIKKSSGDPRMDALVLKTLKQWRFAPLKMLQEEQWGLITFRFQLQG